MPCIPVNLEFTWQYPLSEFCPKAVCANRVYLSLVSQYDYVIHIELIASKPSLVIFEASSVQCCEERTGAFSHQSDTRPARELLGGLTCANSSVACLCKKATFKKRGQARSTFLPNPHRSVMCGSYFRQLGFKCRLSQLHQCDQEMLPNRLP